MAVDDLLVNRGTAVCNTMSGGIAADTGPADATDGPRVAALDDLAQLWRCGRPGS